MKFIKLKLNTCYQTYWYKDASDIPMNYLGTFFSSEVGCPAYTWDNWIMDTEDDETSGNEMVLEKEKGYIYISSLYDENGYCGVQEDQSKKLKISANNLLQLISDWKEKVCKKMPQEVTITYDSDAFILITSDEIN